MKPRGVFLGIVGVPLFIFAVLACGLMWIFFGDWIGDDRGA